MAVPKRRTSKSRRDKRRAHDAISAIPVNNCANCGAVRRPHRVCPECGYYKEKQVAPAAE